MLVITAITLLLPLDPSNPTWQLRLISRVIHGASLAYAFALGALMGQRFNVRRLRQMLPLLLRPNVRGL